MSFANAYAKSQDSAFRNRLKVALLEHCRWELQRAQLGGESADRYAARQSLARTVRARITTDSHLTQMAIYALLPWGSYDPDNDTALSAKIGAIFVELGDVPVPA